MALPLFKLQTKVDTNYQIIQKTYDADNVIYNYEWFKQRYEDIGAQKTKIVNAETAVEEFKNDTDERSTWTFEDKTEYARLQSVATGNKQHLQDLIAEYNARAKMENRSIFQDGLPLFIDLH